MLIIPAIDLKDGKCVRLKQGAMDDATVFSDDPAAMAQHWLEQGARRLHLVDLNGASAGKPKNENAIKAIAQAVGDEMPMQLGGGIRDLDTIERYLDHGVSYVIIGTAAVKTPGFLHDACYAFPGPRDGRARREGRQSRGRRLVQDDRPRRGRPREEISGLRRRSDHLHRHRPRRHADRRQHRSDRRARARADGAGDRERRDHQSRRHQGAVRSRAEGITGAITGRAVYQGTLDFAEAQKLADELIGKNVRSAD